MPGLRENLPTVMLLVGIGMLLLILFPRYFRYQAKLKRQARREARQKQVAPGNAAVASPFTHLADAPAEMVRWQVELHDLARDAKAEIDSKIRILQTLLIQAQEVETRLQQIVRQADGYTVPLPWTRTQQADVYRLADQGIDQAGIAEHAQLPLADVELILGIRGRSE